MTTPVREVEHSGREGVVRAARRERLRAAPHAAEDGPVMPTDAPLAPAVRSETASPYAACAGAPPPSAETLLARIERAGPAALDDHELLALVGIHIDAATLAAAGGLRELLDDPDDMLRLVFLPAGDRARVRAVLDLHARWLEARLRRDGALTSPDLTRRYLESRLHGRRNEVFVAVFLDSHHRPIAYEELFNGTVDGATVHPRVVVRRALMHNAAALVVGHGHPSGIAEPSFADRAITKRLAEALALVDVRLIDHFVVGEGESVSFAGTRTPPSAPAHIASAPQPAPLPPPRCSRQPVEGDGRAPRELRGNPTGRDQDMTTLIYAGIGSRATPGLVLADITKMAGLARAHGLASRERRRARGRHRVRRGAPAGQRTLYLPWPGYNGHAGPNCHALSRSALSGCMEISARLHPAWHRCSPAARKLHARNAAILLGV